VGIGNLPKYVQDEADLIIILRLCKKKQGTLFEINDHLSNVPA